MKLKLAILIGVLLGSVCAFSAGPVAQYQTNNAGTNRTTSAWGTIVSSLSRDVNWIDVYNSSTSGTLILGAGAYGAEYNLLYIPPNVSKVIPMRIQKGKQVNLKALNATVNAGELILNFIE